MQTDTVARNFVKRYGRPRLVRLLEALQAGESGESIAAEFSVSRERVRQWKNAFGTVVTIYQIHPEVERLAATPPPGPPTGGPRPAASGRR